MFSTGLRNLLFFIVCDHLSITFFAVMTWSSRKSLIQLMGPTKNLFQQPILAPLEGNTSDTFVIAVS